MIGDFTGVVDIPSFYKKFCTPQDPDSGGVATAGDLSKYPNPSSNLVTASSLATISRVRGLTNSQPLLAFDNEGPAEFQTVVQDFFSEAKADGKAKLVIDLQASGGGYVFQGYDFYRQMFPHIQEDDISRWKDNPGFLTVSRPSAKSWLTMTLQPTAALTSSTTTKPGSTTAST